MVLALQHNVLRNHHGEGTEEAKSPPREVVPAVVCGKTIITDHRKAKSLAVNTS